MGLFKKKEAPRSEVIEWCANQYEGRAQSIEAQELTMHATEAGWSTGQCMWEFLTSQWPMVVQEAQRKFRSTPVNWLYKDVGAMEAAVRRAGPSMFPLSHEGAVSKVLAILNQVAEDEGWASS